MGRYCAEPKFGPVRVCRLLVEAEGCRFDCGYHACYVSISFFLCWRGPAFISPPPFEEWDLNRFLFRFEEYPSIQLIAVGPVIDLYGKFTTEKLARPMEIYPDRVYSKPEFTALPPYLFSGADFALIPSRDEPFGLVAVEFGRKGTPGVGSRLGGLGLMPGWVSGLPYKASYDLTDFFLVVPCRIYFYGAHVISVR